MKKILCLLLLFVCMGGSAQNYDAEWYYNQGCAYGDAGNNNLAITYFKKANELVGGNNVLCLSAIGFCYYEMGNYALSALWYEQAAKLGDAYSQVNLGYQYYEGEGVSKDYSKAIYWFRKAAAQGTELAYENLGECYYYGRGVPKDMSQAKYWYAKAGKADWVAKCEREIAQSNEAHDAQWYLDKGNEYFDAENWDQAIIYFKKANELAGGNNSACQYNIGLCHNQKKEYEQAVYWYRKAAEQGYALAQCNLGYCYENGTGVTEDKAQAVHWYRKAAEQGYARAQCNLGNYYFNGKVVAEDHAKAFYWYQKAAEQGDAIAQYNLGCCYNNGIGIAEDQVKAFYWYQKAAEQGLAMAQDETGRRYATGDGVEENDETAVYWHRKAAEQGNGNSMIRLGCSYYYGSGVPEDKSLGKYWMKKGLENNPTGEHLISYAKLLISIDENSK